MAAIHILAGLALLPLCLAATCKTDVKKGGRGDACSAQWCEEGMCCGKATKKVETSLRRLSEMNVCNKKQDADYLDMDTAEVFSFDCLPDERGEDWGFETLDCQKPGCKEPETKKGKEGDTCSAQWCGEGLCCGKATSRADSSDVMNMCYDKQRTEYLDEDKFVTYDFDCLDSERGETWGFDCEDEEPEGDEDEEPEGDEDEEPKADCKEPETKKGKEGDTCSAQWCGEGLCCGKATSRADSSDVMNMCYDKQRTEYLDEDKFVTYDFDCLNSERGETWGFDCGDEGSGGGCSGFFGFFQNLFGMCKSSTSDTSSSDDVRLFAVLGKPLFQDGPNPASVLLVAAAAGLVLLAVLVHRSRRRQNGFQIAGTETETSLE